MAARIETTVVGSYPQPQWLLDRELLSELRPDPVCGSLRVSQRFLEQAQDDATVLAIRDMELAGIDVISDGEIRRESYSNYFAGALAGLDHERHGEIVERVGLPNPAPRVVGEIHRTRPVQVKAAEFLRRNTDRRIRVTVPGPFTMTQQCQNEHYPDERSLALAFAAAVGEEVRDLFEAGADVVQLDEPYLQARPDSAREYAVEAIATTLSYANGAATALHSCFGYAHFNKAKREAAEGYPFLAELNEIDVGQVVIEAAQPRLNVSTLARLKHNIALGVLDLSDSQVESSETVAARIREAFEYFPPERLTAAPDCGMKYLPRAVAFGKLQALVEGAGIVSAELQLKHNSGSEVTQMSEQPLRVIVTGGGGGIGSEICREFADRGARVAIWELDAAAGQKMADELPNATAFEVDITDSQAVDRTLDATVVELGGVDALINNAGVSLVGDHTHELPDEVWHRSIGVMQTGVFFCSRAAGRHMIKQGKGAIVNISSIRGFSANPGRLPYCAAKAAVIIMTQVMAGEWGPLGIRVNAVAPGVQATGMWKEEVARGLYDEQEYIDVIPARRIGDPREVGRLCAFLVSDEAAYVTGACVTIDGGLTVMPSG